MLRTIKVLSSPHTATAAVVAAAIFIMKNGKDSMTLYVYNGIPLTLACNVTNNVCCTANLGSIDSKHDAVK